MKICPERQEVARWLSGFLEETKFLWKRSFRWMTGVEEALDEVDNGLVGEPQKAFEDAVEKVESFTMFHGITP
jgi:hypothetical protein